MSGFAAPCSLSRCISVVILLSLHCHCCYANVGQLLLANGTDLRMPNVVFTAADTSLLSCGVKCTRSTDCLSVNYHRTTRTCELSSSSGNDTGVARISAVGWSVYKLKYDCPNSVYGFIEVGSMRIKLCPELLTWQKATAACSQFGRLVKIDTVTKMDALRAFLWNYPNDVWINGNRNWYNSNWFFDDGTSMPPCSDPKYLGWNPRLRKSPVRATKANYGIQDE